MKDIMNMKLKKTLNFKDLPKASLKSPKLNTKLPFNKGMKNIMDITSGKPIGNGFSKHFKFNTNLDTKDMYKLRSEDKKLYRLKGNTNEFYKIKGSSVNPVKNKNFPLKTMGINRIKQQKGLNPWGDYDGDKLINMLDCNPRNKKLQGPAHTFRVDQEEPDYEQTDEYSYVSPERSIEDSINPEDELARSYTEDVNSNVKSLYTRENIQERLKSNDPSIREGAMLDKQEIEREKELERYRKNIVSLDFKERQKRLALLKRKQQEQELDYKKRQRELKEFEEKKKKAKTVSTTKRAIQPVTGAFSTISEASRSLGGFGVSQQGIRGASATNTSQYKILVALGKVAPMQQQIPQQGTLQQAQAQPETTVVSPYSKRKVSYVRGPYKK